MAFASAVQANSAISCPSSAANLVTARPRPSPFSATHTLWTPATLLTQAIRRPAGAAPSSVGKGVAIRASMDTDGDCAATLMRPTAARPLTHTAPQMTPMTQTNRAPQMTGRTPLRRGVTLAQIGEDLEAPRSAPGEIACGLVIPASSVSSASSVAPWHLSRPGHLRLRGHRFCIQFSVPSRSTTTTGASRTK